jgi:hypothetical protein
MKKVLVFLVVITLASCAALNRYPVLITMEDAVLIENNSVGNEWSTTATVDGTELAVGESIVVDLRPGVLLEATATEQDSIPDVGQVEKTLRVYDLISTGNLIEYYRVRLDVVVTEDQGTYAGNTALWQYMFLIEPALAF